MFRPVRFLLCFALLPGLTACGTFAGRDRPPTGDAAGGRATAEERFDNHEQLWAARERRSTDVPPHVSLVIQPTGTPDWALWHVHMDGASPFDAVWAMQRLGDGALRPHRAIAATSASFDPQQWAPLDACTLRRTASGAAARMAADVASCSSLLPALGATAALLPIAFDRDGDGLRLRLYSDQARGPAAQAELQRIDLFSGWAAVNGAGPNAPPNDDWHMNRALRLGDEGGRVPLAWRDGQPSGYSLVLERLNYRNGNVPVLKLSVTDDASGHTLAYAWANPEATRIGLNLGWLQVGLERAGAAQEKR